MTREPEKHATDCDMDDDCTCEAGRRPWVQCNNCDEMWCTKHQKHAFECECPEMVIGEEMSPNIKEIIESGQAPGLIIRHPAGETKYISSLAKYPGDPRANVSSMMEATRKAEAQGKKIIRAEDIDPGTRKARAPDPSFKGILSKVITE